MKVVHLTKNDSTKTVHNVQLTSAGIKSWKTRAEHHIIFLFALLHDKRIISSFRSFKPPYTERAAMFMKFDTRVIG